jgi:MFS family permease
MYLTLRDRPARGKPGQPRVRQRVATTVLLLGVVSLFTDISTESVNAILPQYLVLVAGLSPQAFGFVNGLYTGVSAVVRLFGGWLSDHIDHPKWVAFLGYLASALSRVGLLYTTSFSAISIIISGDRLGKGLRTAPRDSLIAASSPPERLGRAFAVHRSLDSLGAAIGPLLAFWILSMSLNGYHDVFVVSLVFAVLGVALLMLIVPDLRPRRGRTRTLAGGAEGPVAAPARPAKVDFRLLLNRRMGKLLVATTVLSLLTVGDAFLYLALQLRDDYAGKYFPLLVVGMNTAYLLVAIPLGRLADRYGRVRVFVSGHIALLICYFCAAGPYAGPVLSIGCLFMLGTYYACTDGILAALAGRTVDPAIRTSGIATAQTFQALAGFVSSIVVGVLWNDIGLDNAIRWFGVILLVCIPFAAWTMKGTNPRVLPEPALAVDSAPS